MFLGAHTSTSGGIHKAVERIQALGGSALQLFTKNQRQWRVSPLTPEELNLFFQAREAWGDYPIGAHDSYLINLAGNKPENVQKSLNLFVAELQRIHALRIPYLITHPGSHLGDGVEAGLERYVNRLDQAFEQADEQAGKVNQGMVLIEVTAGMGTNLGSTFEEVNYILTNSKFPERLGVCFDTCHAFCAGYDMRDASSYVATFSHFNQIIGLEKLKFFHINDSKNKHNSKKDRHEHVGKGEIGLEAFRLLINDARFRHVPMVIETPKDKNTPKNTPDTFDLENLRVLRALVKS